MSKFTRLLPWFAAITVAWLMGYIYNARYGGELSWLRMMYRQKMALAAKAEAPRRLLITAGSGAHYSINSEIIEQELGIPAFNLGLQGDLGLNVILPLILEQVRPGDIVLVIPEYLMLLDEDGLGQGDGLYGSAPFGIAIGKPGLGGVPPKQLAEDAWKLGVPTLRAVSKSALDIAQKGRMTGYLSDPITDRGDATVVKERTGEWWKMKFKKPVSQHSVQRLAQFKQEVQDKGATLIVSLPWVYASTDEKTVSNVKKTAEKLSRVVPLVYDEASLNIQTDVSMFADTHYHLLPEARIVRSRELVEQIKPLIADIDESN